MPPKKKKPLTKKKIRKSPVIQFVIDYQRIILLLGPILLIIIIFGTVFHIENNAWPKIEDFLSYIPWNRPEKNQTTSSVTNWTDPDDVVVQNPPSLPELDETLPTNDILDELETLMAKIANDNFTFELVQKIYDEATADLEKGVSEKEVKEKLIFGYKLAQEMNWAYQNKLTRFRESTMSSQ